MSEVSDLEKIAQDVRKDVMCMLVGTRGGHFGGAYSCIETLVALYFKIMKKNDVFILSKAHASVSLYSILAKKGILDKKTLKTYGKYASPLGVHAEKEHVPGIEFSCGSLGHGLSFGAGIAWANKLKNSNDKVYVLIGDGESEEGTVWEAAMFAPHHKLDNLVAILDYNKIQSMDRIEDVVSFEPIVDKWKAFGWNVLEMNGHDFSSILKTFKEVAKSQNKPTIIIAHTVKGKGFSFMENQPLWHYRCPNPEELKIAKEKLCITEEDLKP
jgi:transketolase